MALQYHDVLWPVADPMTAERNLGNPNSSSNYPAYEAASLDGIARSKCLRFDHLIFSIRKGSPPLSERCVLVRAYLFWERSASLKAVNWKENACGSWGKGQCYPHQPLNAIGSGEKFETWILCWESTSMERSELLWARYRKTIVCPNQNLQYQTPPPQKCKWSR